MTTPLLDQAAKAKAELIAELRKVLAYAEEGSITDVLFVCSGPQGGYNNYCIQSDDKLAGLMWENALFVDEVKGLINGQRMADRQKVQEVRRPPLVS